MQLNKYKTHLFLTLFAVICCNNYLNNVNVLSFVPHVHSNIFIQTEIMIRKNVQCFLIFFLMFVLILILFNYPHRNKDKKYVENKMCFTHEVKRFGNYSNSVVFFEDLVTSFKQPVASKAIFYVNVNCSTSGMFEITPR